MKVITNGLQLNNKNTGVQYYTENLYEELRKYKDQNHIFDMVQSKFNKYAHLSKNRVIRICFENLCLPFLLHINEYDLYHSPNYVLPYFIQTHSVLTIHDLITLDYPEFCQTESVLYFKMLFSRSIKKATKIIAVSKKVKEDILRHFNIPQEKIEVIYHGVKSHFKKVLDKELLIKIKIKYLLPDKYILFVGNIEPKKNLEKLIKAYDILKKNSDIKHKLVITGKNGWKYKSVYKIISELKIENEIIFTDYVPEDDLPAIYSMSDLFAFPSLYEGFGIPPLEAMACEVPVIVSNKGALPEITGGKCMRVDPYSISDICNGIYKLLTENQLRNTSILEGKEWVKHFSWEKTAKETLKVYEQAIITHK